MRELRSFPYGNRGGLPAYSSFRGLAAFDQESLMRVYVLRRAGPRSPLARFALGLAVVLGLAGLALVLLPLMGIALVVGLVGVAVLTVAGLVMRWIYGKELRAAAQAARDATQAQPDSSGPRPWKGRMKDVEDVEVVEVVRELPPR